MMRRATWSVLIVFGLVCAVSAKSGFFAQEESAQHLLRANGDTFRFFRHNIICSNWRLAGFENKEKTDAEPSLHLFDDSLKEGSNLHSHHVIVCQPFTRYRLRFKCKLNSYEGGPLPSAEISLFDFNRDYIRALVFEIPAGDAGKGWIDKQFDFITPFDVQALMGSFESKGKTVCDIVFDEVYVEQISEPEAYRPEPRILVSVLSARNGTLGEEKIDGEEEACPFSFGFSWTDHSVQQSLVFEWLDRQDNVIAMETCRFSPVVGLRPEWNGVQAEWFRRYNDSADGVHCRRDRFYNTSVDSGSGTLDGMLMKPDKAEKIRIRFADDSAGKLEVRDFVLKAQSLVLP